MNTKKESQGNAIYFLLLLVPLFWGGAFGAAKHVITEIPPITAATLRFGFAGLLLLPLVLIRSEWRFEVIKKRWIGLILMAITGIFAYNAFFFIALEYTSAINGSLVMATTPVFMTLGAVLFLKEQWSKRIGFGLLLSLSGVFLVIMKGSLQTLLSLSVNMGDLLFLAALFCWVVHGLIGKVVMNGVSPLLTTTFTTIAGSAMLGIWSLFENGWSSVPSMSNQSWAEIIYMSIFATVVAFLLWNRGIYQVGASKSSMYMNLVPINAAWIAVLFYGSVMEWQQIAGMIMVLTGVYFSASSNKQTARPKQHKKIYQLKQPQPHKLKL
ncbi:DMT family transporter [Pseudalkalibacillus caeni]|uniref:DMT family transporter n=1 Tax=Exobacillus caeni TaxID=2574798 RepID=A0A5R9F4F0_9BACL|nr:DMT family transporter [Pseudalkalibacillus caeni]TLS37236.1 DMT family transporter [Pseudalkalibacillus caeni]